MTYVFATSFDGKAGAIRLAADQAVLDVAARVWGPGREHAGHGKLEPVFNLYGKIEHMTSMYENLLGPGMAPSVAHMLGIELASGNGALASAAIEIHDTDSAPGNPGYVATYDLARQNDPSFHLVQAVVRMHREEITLAEASLRMRVELARILPYGSNAANMSQLREFCKIQELFGYPDGDPRNLFTANMTGKEMKLALEWLPDMAEKRLRTIMADLTPSVSPTP